MSIIFRRKLFINNNNITGIINHKALLTLANQSSCSSRVGAQLEFQCDSRIRATLDVQSIVARSKYFLESWTRPKILASSLSSNLNPSLNRKYHTESLPFHQKTNINVLNNTLFSFNTMNSAFSNGYSTGVDLKVDFKSQSKTIQDLASVDSIHDFMNGIDAVMFDCDGVLWIGMRVLPNAPELVKKLRAMGKKVFFMTNNSTKTRDEFLVKFNTLGFEATLDEIVSTSYLAALYLKEQSFNKKVYVIGTPGVTKELQAANIESLPIGPDVIPSELATWSYDHLTKMTLDPEVGAVVVGFDHHFSYAKLFKAASYLNNSSCLFIATNTDENFPSGSNMVIPGTGSIVNSVKTAAGRDPIVMGKPSKIPFDYVKRSHSLIPQRVLMVGDRANTDILFGNNCELRTLLVLTGVTSLGEVKSWAEQGSELEKQCVPEFFLPDVGKFHKLIEAL